MAGETQLLTLNQLASMFGGDEAFHKKVLENKFKFHISDKYIKHSDFGGIFLSKDGLSEYEEVLTMLLGLTERHPWREQFYTIENLLVEFGSSNKLKFHDKLKDLYNKLEAGIDCGLNKGDIIKTAKRIKKGDDPYVYYLKKEALQRFSDVIHLPLKHGYKWLGTGALKVMGFRQIHVPEALKWAYEQIQLGNDIGLKPSDMRVTHSHKARSENGITYNIKSTALDQFIKATGLKRPGKTDTETTIEDNENNKAAKFKSASQIVHDALGFEWTQTYTRTPNNNDER